MFGPNVKADERGHYYHHREESFHILLKTLEEAFVGKFGLDDYNILFLTGSGTTANESVLFSSAYDFHCIFVDAEFGLRLKKISKVHEFSGSSNIGGSLGRRLVAYPYYETSISRLNFATTLVDSSDLIFLDMVSAFPYYMPPKGTAIWTTVSSKQLGAYPVLGIVALHKSLDLEKIFADHDGSCLNILGHMRHRKNSETQNTPAIPLYYDLLQKIRNFDREFLVKKINERRKRIVHRIGIDNVIGVGPVVTFKANDDIASVAREFNLYKSKMGYQIFLWSGTDEEYESLYRALERAKNG